MASALNPASPRSDTCKNGVCASHAGGRVRGSQVAAHHSGTKLTQGGFLGLSPCQTAHLVALPAEQTDHPATQVSCPTGDEDHFFAPAGETQRRTRPIIIWTASSGLTPSLRTSCFQVWKSSAKASTARRC